jgi:hypothetical protein
MCKPNGNETAPLLQELENQRSPVASFAEKSLMNRLEKNFLQTGGTRRQSQKIKKVAFL